MASKLSVKKDNATRVYVGGELIYMDSAKTKQVKEMYVIKDGVKSLVWQYDITAPTIKYSPTDNPYYSFDNVTVTASATDTESGLKSLTIDGVNTTSKTYTPTTTKRSIPIVATDNAGNVATKYAYIQKPSSDASVEWGYAWASSTAGRYTTNMSAGGTSVGIGAGDVGTYREAYGGGRIRLRKGFNYVTCSANRTYDANRGGGSCYVKDLNGNNVRNLGEGTYNISAYADGLHWVEFDAGWITCGVDATVRMEVNLRIHN